MLDNNTICNNNYNNYDNTLLTIGDLAWYGGLLLFYTAKESKRR